MKGGQERRIGRERLVIYKERRSHEGRGGERK